MAETILKKKKEKKKNVPCFTPLEIKEIKESLDDYKTGNYKTFNNINNLIKELHNNA